MHAGKRRKLFNNKRGRVERMNTIKYSTFLSHASRPTVTYTNSASYSPSIWAPGTRVLDLSGYPGTCEIPFEIPRMAMYINFLVAAHI